MKDDIVEIRRIQFSIVQLNRIKKEADKKHKKVKVSPV